MGTRDKAKAAFIAEFDQRELAVRLMEVAIGARRPLNDTSTKCLDELPPEFQYMRWQFMKMAEISFRYMEETINNGKAPS